MEIINVEQRSPEWYKARLGIPTSSNFDKLITTDGKPSKQRIKYIYQLAGERITGQPTDTYSNGIMERGREIEEEARRFYELLNDVEIQKTGFFLSNGYGASPDGLVGKDGIIEIKCPLIHTHIEYILSNVLPKIYFQQVEGLLLVTERKWCDFVSYYPGLKPLIVRVERDEKFIPLLREQLDLTCKEIEEVTKKLK